MIGTRPHCGHAMIVLSGAEGTLFLFVRKLECVETMVFITGEQGVLTGWNVG